MSLLRLMIPGDFEMMDFGKIWVLVAAYDFDQQKAILKSWKRKSYDEQR
jgi:hypothetical protein